MLYTDTYYQNLYKFPLENGRKQLFKNGWEMCKAELTRTMDHHGNLVLERQEATKITFEKITSSVIPIIQIITSAKILSVSGEST